MDTLHLSPCYTAKPEKTKKSDVLVEMVFWSFTFQNLSEVDTFQNETEVKSSLFVVRHGINRLLSESKAKV